MVLIAAASIVGGIIGVIGAIVLAVGLSGVLLTLKNHIVATDTTIEFMLRSQNIPRFIGWEQAHAREFGKAKLKTLIGICCVLVGFLLQSLSVLLQVL